MRIFWRAEWGARHPNGFRSSPLPARELWLHHSVTLAPDIAWIDADRDGVEDDEERAMRAIEDIGQQRFGGGFSYTFALPPAGRIYEGHSVDRQGAHTKGRNDIARAIVLIGNYENNTPTEEQIRGVAWLIVHGYRQGWWTVTQLSGGHQQAPGQDPTACPGRHAMAAITRINQLAAAYLRGEIDLDQEDDVVDAAQEDRIAAKAASSVFARMVPQLQIGGGRVPVPFQIAAEFMDIRAQNTDTGVAKAFAAVGRQIDAMGTALRQLAEQDDRITLSPADLETLRASVTAELDELAEQQQRQLAEIAEQQQAQVAEQLREIAAELAGKDADAVLAGLGRFFGVAVDAVGSAPATT